MPLSEKHCIACDGDTPTLTTEEVEKFLSEVIDWETNDDASKIMRTFKFRDFAQSMIFVNAVGEVAEEENHHPDIEIHYNKVMLTLWTHAIGGLSENDFILAAKIDELPEGHGEMEKEENFLVG